MNKLEQESWVGGMKDWEMGTGKEDNERGKKLLEIDSGTGRRNCDRVCMKRIKQNWELGGKSSLGMAKHVDQSRKLVVSHSQKLRMGTGELEPQEESCK